MFNQAKNASKIESTTKKLDKLLAERVVKDETKNVSLGTSKINYNDPRITVAWCKRHEVRQVPKPLVVTPPHSLPAFPAAELSGWPLGGCS